MSDLVWSDDQTTYAEKKMGLGGAEAENGVSVSEVFNASGHADQLHRQYGLLSICATALTIGMSLLLPVGSEGMNVVYRQCVGCPWWEYYHRRG